MTVHLKEQTLLPDFTDWFPQVNIYCLVLELIGLPLGIRDLAKLELGYVAAPVAALGSMVSGYVAKAWMPWFSGSCMVRIASLLCRMGLDK